MRRLVGYWAWLHPLHPASSSPAEQVNIDGSARGLSVLERFIAY